MKNLHSAFRIPHSALALLVAMFLAVGCAKESLNPDQTDAILALSHIENPETPDPDPEVDCKCYMSITGGENLDTIQANLWIIGDVTYSPLTSTPVILEGSGDSWLDYNATSFYQSFPTPYFELDAPSNGWHNFEWQFFPSAPEGAKLFATVRCYLQNGNGTQTLLTTTYHTFEWEEGNQVPPKPAEFARAFRKFFSCLVQTDDPPKEADDN